ncbi:hypothetical protein Y032_0013g2162 [Ancylostoma ceylanicum]|uniref:Uncharacterized protein n=1 Tax=Ancylostoma ceylanicum TaxID=53326 RepID=A0A016VC99_9BILA|nr:hypothetical protein Y032_0013g2162 [Ancylostoma ceylanicum]
MLLSSHNTVTACPPGGNQPATIALFTDSDYNPANYNYFKSVAIKLLRESLARYGITYVDGFTTITPRSSRHGKVIIDVYVPTGVNCDTACPPDASQSATIALFTNSDYNPADYNYYKTTATNLLRQSLARFGIPYVDGFTTITPRSSRHGKTGVLVVLTRKAYSCPDSSKRWYKEA